MPSRTPFRLAVALEPHGRPDAPSWRDLVAVAREADPDLISLVDPAGGVSERLDARDGVAGPAVRRPVPRASPPRFGEAPEALEVVHPRQSAPVVLVLARSDHAYRVAARVADAVVITAVDTAEVRELVGRVRTAEHEVGRGDRVLPVLADLTLALADEGPELRAGARTVATGADDTARLLRTWRAAGVDGVRLRPAVLPGDLEALARLVPVLRAAGLRPPARGAPRPAVRDAAIGADR